MNAELFYDKEIVCPICETVFPVWFLKGKAFRRIGNDTDFRPRIEGVDPLYYDVWVCVHCGYSALKKDFENLSRHEKKEIAGICWARIEEGGAPGPLPYPRNLEGAVESYRRALEFYAMRRPREIKEAVLRHRMAWLFRRENQKQKELNELSEAVKKYTESYFAGGPFPEKLGEPGIMYLIGELWARLDSKPEAVRWFRAALEHDAVDSRPFVKRMAREGLYRLGEDAQAAETKPVVEAEDYDIPLEEAEARLNGT